MVLPLVMVVLTAFTLTPNSASTAFLIIGLVADFATWNTTAFEVSPVSVAFSVMIGLTITS